MTLTHSSMGAVVVRPAILTLAFAVFTLDDLSVNPDIAIFAFLQTDVAARENLPTSGNALEVLRCHAYVALSFARMLAPWNTWFDLFLIARCRGIPGLAPFQACTYMAAQHGSSRHSDTAHLFAFFAACCGHG